MTNRTAPLAVASRPLHSSDALIVHEDVADEFIKVLSGMLDGRSASAVADGTFGYRGLFSQTSASRVTALVKDATDRGAKVIIGKQATEGNVVQPVVLEGHGKESRIYSEEIFGPAMTLARFKTTEEAIERANSSEYGLAASVYGSDLTECWNVAKEIESGQVHINGSTLHDAQTVGQNNLWLSAMGTITWQHHSSHIVISDDELMQIPHGGHKKSGFGRFNGLEGLHEFTQTKTITIK